VSDCSLLPPDWSQLHYSKIWFPLGSCCDCLHSTSLVPCAEPTLRPMHPGINTFFGRAAALISATNNVANITKVMTKIGAICLVTIGAWIVIELGVSFGLYRHSCKLGAGEKTMIDLPCLFTLLAAFPKSTWLFNTPSQSYVLI